MLAIINKNFISNNIIRILIPYELWALEDKIGINELLKARSGFQDPTNGQIHTMSLIAHRLTIFLFPLKSNC